MSDDPEKVLAAALLDAERISAGVRPGGLTKHATKVMGNRARALLAAMPDYTITRRSELVHEFVGASDTNCYAECGLPEDHPFHVARSR